VRHPDEGPASPAEGGSRYAEPREVPERREEDRARGFGYTPGDPATGSMTTGGLSSLLTLKAVLDEQGMLEPALRRRLDQAAWDAIAWLARHYDLTTNPPVGALWHYYYLYGLERALVIAQKRLLGSHDWWSEGARLLVAAQTEDGAWRPPSPLLGFGGPGGPGAAPYDTALLDTCFALLFLRRAAFPTEKPLLEPPAPVTGR
jgi:hypothetical protein